MDLQKTCSALGKNHPACDISEAKGSESISLPGGFKTRGENASKHLPGRQFVTRHGGASRRDESLDLSMPPRQETLRSQQIAMPFLGVLFAPGTQPSGSELAAPSFAGHIDHAAPSLPQARHGGGDGGDGDLPRPVPRTRAALGCMHSPVHPFHHGGQHVSCFSYFCRSRQLEYLQ